MTKSGVKIQKIERKITPETDAEDCGVQATAEILIPYGDHWITQTITSPGLWGIDENSSDSYLDEVYDDEKEILLDMLSTLGIELP